MTELLVLGVTPFVLLGRLNKYVSYFLFFFTGAVLISLLVTSHLSFTYLEPSFLKRPYWITIGRYIEIISCLMLCNIVFLYFQSLKKKGEFTFYLSKFIDLNIAITVLFAFIYLLVIFNIISINDTRLVYGWDIRLRGYFVEGGPYGLMLSFIFILSSLLKDRKGIIIRRIFLFIVIVFMAQSKAGTLCCVVWLGVENFGLVKDKLKPILLPAVIVFLIGFFFLFKNISHMYIDHFDNIKVSVKERPNDPNLVLGRIPGFFIAPKIIQENPIFGIGIGNYPLIRNNKEYRGIFPLPPKKIRNLDAHGYGGIVDILVDNGVLGVLVFFSILGIIFKRIRVQNGKTVLLIGFVLLFIFGVQIHFMYPWILLGLALTGISETNGNTLDDPSSKLKILGQ
ncbi:O-antigen ligase [uncultured Aquimarina sp.]|uniref:O-antigen ligase family protein n=1 Tax=uncultured Aquimarina sp. TaxID=575652 RepID=UPI00263120D7|nr:O-antigen ligase family protein [uncultured Aquimarina sp.]